MLKKFVNSSLIPLGVIADINCHELDITQSSSPEKWNPHAHILISTRHLVDDDFGLKIKELNKKDFVVSIRKAWSENVNEALSKAGIEARIDHRSLADRGIDLIPREKT